MRGLGPWFALVALLALAWPSVGAAASLGAAGAKAFDMARSADEAAGAAEEEGGKALAQVKALAPSGRDVEALKPLLEEAEAAYQAAAAYRRQTQASATEAIQILAEAARTTAAAAPDPIRRDVLEQRALLAAHEAAVMAARTRSEAERLRAVLAEARMAAAAGGKTDARGSAAPSAGTAPRAAPGGAGLEVVVPNLVGARLEAAIRDLNAAELRLGETTGPREGFVVKQAPEAGARVPRQTGVSVTLSASAATTTVPRP